MRKNLKTIGLMLLGLVGSSFLPLSHIQGHIDDGESFVSFTNNGVTSPIYTINNTNTKIVDQAVGFHLALIPSGEKFIPIAYDIVPLKDHERAEAYVMTYAKSKGLKELPVEQYSLETIHNAEIVCQNDGSLNVAEKDQLLLVIRQTQAYMQTEYFKQIYVDHHKIRSPQEVLDWISANTILNAQIAEGLLNKQSLKLQKN